MSREWFEVAFAELYPVIYSHRDAAEAHLAAATFAPLLHGRGPVVDLACGDGRYLDAFGERGIRLLGVDLSGFLLDRAVERPGLSGRLVCADMRCLPFQSGMVDGVINMFTSFGYMETDEENAAVLQEVARVLRPAGVFLLDFINSTAVLRRPPDATVRESGGYTIAEERKFLDERRSVVKHVHVTDTRGAVVADYDERVRLYTRKEFVEMLAALGMWVRDTFGDYDGAPFDPETSPRLILDCVKE